MSCKKIISNLNAYADGELSARRHRLTKAHLDNCAACRNRLEEMERLGAILAAGLPVPPVPPMLAARVMAAARKETADGRFFWPFINPLVWFREFSAPMRLAVSAATILAFVCGLSLNSGSNNAMINRSGANNLYGLEWFGANPPGSIGAAYIAMK